MDHGAGEHADSGQQRSTSLRLLTLYVFAVLAHVLAFLILGNALAIVVTALLAWLAGSSMIFSKIMDRRQRSVGVIAALAAGACVMLLMIVMLLVDPDGYLALYWLFGSWIAFPVIFVIGTLMGEGEQSM
jgi:ribose/xylose/arabinose/galactoside ABC-type transport system permease subunit